MRPSNLAAKWYSYPTAVHAMINRLRLRAASQGMETHPVSNSDEQLRAVLAMLEECRTALAAAGNRDTAHLVSVAVLDIRMKLNRIGDDELRLLCDAMAAREFAADAPQYISHESRSSSVAGQRPLLRVVK